MQNDMTQTEIRQRKPFFAALWEKIRVALHKKTFAGWISSLLFVLAFLLALVILLGRITGKNLLPYAPIWVISDSMEDTIPAQSYIWVHYVNDASEIQVGDVITFVSSDPDLAGELNTHRVTQIIGQNEAFITKGDAAPKEDSYTVSASAVRAVYVRNMPLFTIFGRIFATSFGLVTVILLSILLCTIWTAYYFKKETARVRKEKLDALVAAEVARLEAEHKDGTPPTE